MTRAFWNTALRFTTVFMAVVAAASCSDGTGPVVQPQLPPVASMQMDVSFFDETSGAAREVGAEPGSHFVTSAFVVSVARAATTLALALPVLTFGAAASNEPVREGNTYHWRYSVSESGQIFEADLSGRASGVEAIWEMRITATAAVPPLEGFLWYSGRAALARNEGEWRIFDASNPSAQVELLRIHWEHNGETDWRIVFTNVNPDSPDQGDWIEYEASGVLRRFNHFDESTGALSIIQWNEQTNEGYIQAPNYNGGVRSCWNAALENAACVV